MKVFLRDINSDLVKAWKFVFEVEGVEDVYVSEGDIFAYGDHLNVDAIVSPANSFGFMDGGIDYVYSEKFGWEMSKQLQKNIKHFNDGELLVGQASLVDISLHNPNTPIKHLIAAPTMRVPGNVANTVNAYLAFKAALRMAKSCNFDSILCPGMATAIGEMDPSIAAIQMRLAHDEVLGDVETNFSELRDHYFRQRRMTDVQYYVIKKKEVEDAHSN